MSEYLDYRLRIKDVHGNRTYLVRRAGNISYLSSGETPLALANLLQEDAAETRFLLQDAKDGRVASEHLTKVLARRWRNNMPLCPAVEVLQ